MNLDCPINGYIGSKISIQKKQQLFLDSNQFQVHGEKRGQTSHPLPDKRGTGSRQQLPYKDVVLTAV